jgi:hypothetical protein
MRVLPRNQWVKAKPVDNPNRCYASPVVLLMGNAFKSL